MTTDEMITLLFTHASDYEAEALESVLIRAGLLVKCGECGWTNPPAEVARPCEGCGAMPRCKYDTGSMYGCESACSERATRTLTYAGYGGTYTMPLCARHVGPMQARLYPTPGIVAAIDCARLEQ